MSNTINVNYMTGMVNILAGTVTQKVPPDLYLGTMLVLDSIADKV